MQLLEVNIPEINFKSQFGIHGISNSHSSVIAKKKAHPQIYDSNILFSFWLINPWQYVQNGNSKEVQSVY